MKDQRSALKYEHLVEVNDPANPLVRRLGRDELWFGLLCRVEDPRAFLPGLERCEVLARTDDTVRRRLHFGGAVIDDRVTLVPLQSVCFETEANAEHVGGSLTISIEEPQDDVFFLRFAYATGLAEGAASEDARYVEYVKSAYRESDLDTMRVIRLICESTSTQ